MGKDRDTSHALTSVTSRDLEAQRDYVKEVQAKYFTYDLMVADAFVRGMRDIGYRHVGTVLDELIDNSVQAGAENVLVEFGYHGKSDEKPTEIAVIDDGHGMDPEMIRLSVIWGGTHREVDRDDRKGFGRYGYGLPSASINQGRRFTVYSKVEGRELHKVAVDLDEIQEGKYTNNGRIIVPEPVQTELPDWLEDSVWERLGKDSMTRGTIVVIEKLDRITWKTKKALEQHILPHFGSTYRNYLREVNLWVNGKSVRPVDPLFLMSGHQFYDVDDDRAEAYPPLTIDVKDKETRKSLGTVKVRFSYMPPNFARATEEKYKTAGKKNPRFAVLKENIGIHVLREGRQIDVVTRNPWTTFRNDDRYWGVEIDFPATLDEEFQITTNKQQVVLTDRMWEILEQNGVLKAIQEMRSRYNREKRQLDVSRENDDKQQRASEQAMQKAEKFRTTGKPVDSPERRSKGLQAFNSEIHRRSKLSGVAPEQIERELFVETQGYPFRVEEEYLPGAPFFRAEQRGGQMVLKLNTAHRFFQDVYADLVTPGQRSALEVLLFVIGDCELDASGDRQDFYRQERAQWSNKLEASLNQLRQIDATAEVAQDLSDDVEERADREAAFKYEIR